MLALLFLLGNQGVIEGTVRDSAGAPVGGATVAAVSYTLSGDRTDAAALATTAADGRFRLVSLAYGEYGVTATSPGRTAAYQGHVKVAAGAAARADLIVGAGASVTLRGTVRDSGGHAVAGAEVRALRFSEESGDIFYGAADAAGAFALTVPTAQYVLAAHKDKLETLRPQRTAIDKPTELIVHAKPSPGPAPREVVEWLKSHAVALTTPEAGHGFDDMKPIAKIVGDARIVQLGEATHGTREFFQLKHRMLEYLVSELGFTVFSIEANWPESLAVDEYVRTGKGDPGAALSGMYFWTWNTEEVLAMIKWMRKWNEDPAHKKKLRFYGFDMQTPTVAAGVVVDYFKKVDPKFAPRAQELLTKREGLDEVVKRLAKLKRKTAEWTLVEHHLRIVVQASELKNARGGINVRDRSMAENIGWLLDHEPPGTRMVVWAHSGHVARDASFDSMGGYLAKKFGNAMFTFGFAFNQGSFQAMEGGSGSRVRGLREFTVPAAPAGSLDATLAATGLPLAAVDLREVPAGPVADWFAMPHGSRSIGAVFSDAMAANFVALVDARKAFDAILFVSKTTRARPNGKGPPPPAPPKVANLDLEEGATGAEPPAWFMPPVIREGGYKVSVVEEKPHGGKRCVLVAGAPTKPNIFGNVMQRVDATAYRGKRVRFRAAVRSEGRAQLWIRVDRQNGDMGFFDNMEDRPISSNEWKEYTIEGDIDPEAAVLNFGMMLIGSGKAWLDDAKLEVVKP